MRRRLPGDWTERYNVTPVLIETFVETPRYTGAVYRASGWLRVGITQGRGRYDRDKLYRQAPQGRLAPASQKGLAARPQPLESKPHGSSMRRNRANDRMTVSARPEIDRLVPPSQTMYVAGWRRAVFLRSTKRATICAGTHAQFGNPILPNLRGYEEMATEPTKLETHITGTNQR